MAIDKLMEERARLLATLIDVSVNGAGGSSPAIGFVLVLIPPDDAPNVCVSNAAHPRQLVDTLKATVKHLENDPECREH